MKLTKETIRGLRLDFLKVLFLFCALVVLNLILKDPLLFWASLFSFIGFQTIRRKRVLYYEDGIAWDSNNGNTYIHDWAKYFQDPVRRKNLEESLEAIKKIPLGVPLGDDLRPINKGRK